MQNTGLSRTLHRHLAALVLFPLLALAWVGDTLFLGYDLSAFDVITRLPHYKAEHEYRGVQQIILSDSPQAHYPERALKWRAARQGERIDLNPYIFTGVPELSQGTGAFITSPFQLAMDVSEAIDWSTWLRLAVAGLLMYAFLMVLGITRGAAILGGLIWAFNLHQLVWLEFPQHLATQLWIPALFCFNYIVLRRGPSWESVLGILIVNAFFFTGDYIQITLYTYVAIGIFNTVYLATDLRHSARERILRWLTVHGVFILSALLLLPEELVEIHTVADGLRSHQPWRGPPDVDWSLSTLAATAKNVLPDIADFKRFFSPNFFGGLWGEEYRGKQFFGNVVLGSVYSGIAVFVLAPLCLLWLRWPSRRPFILASIAVILFAFGMIHRDPVLIWIFNLIPFGGVGGYPRYLTIVIFLLSVTTAIGLHALMQLKPTVGRKWFWLVWTMIVASPLMIRAVDSSITLQSMSYPLTLLFIIGLATAALSYWGLWRYLAALLIVATAIDLFLVTYDFNPRMEDDRNFVTTPTLDKLIADDEIYRVAQVSTKQLYPPNILQFYAIPSIGGYLTVAPYRYLRFIQETINDHHITTNGQLFFFDANIEIFRLLNVKYILSENKLDDARLELVREAPGYQVYELIDRLPRAYCASDMLAFGSEAELLDSFNDVAGKYDRPLALVADMESTVLTAGCRVSDINATLSGVEFTATSDRATYVLAPYNYSGNWHAHSDTGPIRVLRANYNFLAVPIEAGSQRITLVYRDTENLIFNYAMIGLGVLVIGWFTMSRNRTLTGGLLAFASAVLVLHSLLELPGIANIELPERPEPRAVLLSDN